MILLHTWTMFGGIGENECPDWARSDFENLDVKWMEKVFLVQLWLQSVFCFGIEMNQTAGINHVSDVH